LVKLEVRPKHTLVVNGSNEARELPAEKAGRDVIARA